MILFEKFGKEVSKIILDTFMCTFIPFVSLNFI